MKLTFKQFLIEMMGQEGQSGAGVENMDPDELMKIAKMRKTNPQRANIELIRKIRDQLRVAQDPKEKMALQTRLKKLQASQSQGAEATAV